jgi:signal transduction histidine kinase
MVLAATAAGWWLTGGGPALGSLLLALAAVSFFCARELLGRLKRAYQQTTLLDAQLIQTQKLASIGELSAGVAHEINNPLAIISQETEWMMHLVGAEEGKGSREEDFRDSLQEILHQIERCKEITQNLLSFARRMEPVLQEVNLNKLMEDMTRLVERDAAKRNITIRRHFDKALPPLQSDPPRLRQVILNLLNNARQAMEGGGTITVGTRYPGGDTVEIVVRDTGCGIPREHLGKIFDPFFTTKPQGKGTGLGLSICHGIIERLGGRITVSSEMGKGTAFTLHLPRGGRKGTG